MGKTEEKNETKQRRVKQPEKYVEHVSESRRWTLKEKEQLLQALYKYGHLDVEKIQTEIPTRSHSSIRSAICQWKKEARAMMNKNAKMTKATHKFYDEDVLKAIKSPMLQNTELWVSLLKRILEDKSNIQYGLSNIFLVIAEVGDFPPPELCDGVDFREMYLCMHLIMNGQPCKEVSIRTAAYMFDCFNRMQIASNKLGHDREKTFLEEMYNCSVHSKAYCCPKKSNTSTETQPIKENTLPLEKLLEVPDTNPLKVPLELLVKQSKN